MTDELKEFRDLVDRGDAHKPGAGKVAPPDEEQLVRCVQTLLSRQCIYPWMQSIGPSYRVMSTPDYQGFFQKYFAAMGLEFHHDPRTGMVALKVPGHVSRYDWQAARLTREATAVLAALSVAYEEGHKARHVDEHGRFETTTNDIFDKTSGIAGVEIKETRLIEILADFQRKGVVEIGERDPVDHVRPIAILQGIEIVVPETHRERMTAWCEGKAAAPSAADGQGTPEAEES